MHAETPPGPRERRARAWTIESSTLLRYGVGTLAIALVVLLKQQLPVAVALQHPFLLLSAAVIVAAWFGGLGPGLLATGLGAVAADYLFVEPLYSFSPVGASFWPLLLFGLQGVLISYLVEALRSARRRAEARTLEAQRRQEALSESEERFRLMVEGVRDYAIFMLDPEGRVATWNEGARRTMGYEAREILGRHFSIFCTEEDIRRGYPEEELRIAAAGGCHEEEGLRVCKDGSRFWAHVVTTALKDERGNPKGFSKVVRDITERKRAEEALKASETRYRTLVEQTPAITYVQEPIESDDPKAVTYVSPQYQTILGYPPESEVIDEKHWLRILHPDDRERVLSEEARTDESGEPFKVEYRVIAGDGRVVWVRDEATLVRGEDGEPLYWLGVQYDVTEQKLAEEALNQSEELYRSVVEQAAEIIFLVDIESRRILEANAAFHAALGYAPEELEETTLYDVVAHDRETVDRNIERIVAEGRRSLGERRYCRKGGAPVEVEVSVSIVLHGDREVMCIVAHDVTERKRAEENLRQSLSAVLALREAGQILNSTLESGEIVSRLLEIMRSVSNLTAAVISLQDEVGEVPVWRSAGLEGLSSQVRFLPEAEAARRAALETGERRLFRLRQPELETEDLVGLCLPLRSKDRILGVLEAYGRESLAESATVDVLGSLASQAGSALENALLYEELEKREQMLQDLVGKLLSAQEEEHRRIAYEVHDGLAQVAAAAHQHLQAFAERYSPEAEKGRRDLDRILRLVRATVTDARRVIANLRPTSLDDLGLAAALSLEVENLREEGYGVDYEEDLGDERLPAAAEIALFRVAQEALNNVRKHAQTRRVRIELRRRGDEVLLEVKDYGRGFDPGALSVESGPGARVGLAGMRERINVLGGGLEIRSQPEAGTSVVATVDVRGVPQLPLA